MSLRLQVSLLPLTLLTTLCLAGSTSAFTFDVKLTHQQPDGRRTRTLSVPCSPLAIKHSNTVLNMARGGVHGKKKRMIDSTKRKKTNKPSRPGKHRKTSKRERKGDGGGSNSQSASPRATSAKSSTPNLKLSILGDAKKPGPPWQVMGEKDMEKNVEAEKKRRERIRLGLDSTSSGRNNDASRQKADVSGSSRLISATDRSMISWKRFRPDSACSNLVMVGAYLDKTLPPSLGVPEVAFLGRSNVGKSSLLNRLAFKAGGDTARVGKTPGATASVNLYAMLGQQKKKEGGPGAGDGKPILGFADLPGFGYAKLSKDTKESVEEAAESYLGKRRELALGVLLVDSRRVPNADDRAVLAALYDMGVPLVVVATKSDKLKANEVAPAMKTIREGLGLPEGQPLRVSGVTGEGIKELWRIILDACESRVSEVKTAIEEGVDDGGALRLLANEDGDANDFYDHYEDDDETEEENYFDDDEDIYYDQGYDWVQNSNSGYHDGEKEDFYDSFYDDDGYIENDIQMIGKNLENEEKQRVENESLKLKNLKKVVRQMERKGQI
mmetsp:Transcript_4924/g.10353  ORF Transcript_4924/g.10353 Transcript_4924/m.10353 type:complete len:554 (-) Transcript_4924:17-1678(-)